MKHRATGVAIAAVTSLALIATGQPAQATERQSIDSAVASSLTPAKIEASLGRYKAAYSGQIFRNYGSDWTLCSLRDPDRFLVFSGMDTEVRTFFTPRSADSQQGVQQSQFLFASPAAAQRSFTKLQRNAKKCTGTSTERIDSDDAADSLEWQSTLSNGTMNAVAGVATVTVENDWSRATGGEVDFRQDEFSTYSRVGDAIIRVTYQRSPNGSLSSSERRGVQGTTKSAIEAYQRQSMPAAGSIQGRFARGVSALIDVSDIPASLGARKNFSAQDMRLDSQRMRIWLCDTEGKQFDDDAATAPFIGVTANPVQTSAEYDSNRGAGVTETIMDFASTQRAERAFAQMRSEAKKCTGSFPEQIDDVADDTGEVFSGVITRTFANSEKKVTGSAPSITIDSRITADIPAAGPATTTGAYDVLTLAGSRVVWVRFSTEQAINAKQKKGVEELSVSAVGALR